MRNTRAPLFITAPQQWWEGVETTTRASRPTKSLKYRAGFRRLLMMLRGVQQKKRLSDNVRKGANKAKTVYLLRGKIRCAKCGAIMNGACKTSSRTGTPLYYYLCGNRDRKGSCTMRAVRKDFIEGFVLGEIKKLLSIDVEKVAQKIVALTGNTLEPEYLKKARRQLASVQKQIKAIVSAIKSGAFHLSMALWPTN